MEEKNHEPSQSAKAVRKSMIKQSKSKDMRRKKKSEKENNKKEVKAKSKTETGNKKAGTLTRAQNYRQIAVPVLSHPIPSHPAPVSPRTRNTRVGRALRHPLSVPLHRSCTRCRNGGTDEYSARTSNPIPYRTTTTTTPPAVIASAVLFERVPICPFSLLPQRDKRFPGIMWNLRMPSWLA